MAKPWVTSSYARAHTHTHIWRNCANKTSPAIWIVWKSVLVYTKFCSHHWQLHTHTHSPSCFCSSTMKKKRNENVEFRRALIHQEQYLHWFVARTLCVCVRWYAALTGTEIAENYIKFFLLRFFVVIVNVIAVKIAPIFTICHWYTAFEHFSILSMHSVLCLLLNSIEFYLDVTHTLGIRVCVFFPSV